MPPVTPSPHRFLIGRRRQQSPPKDPKPASALPRQAPRQQEATPPKTAFVPNASQFAHTPRFSIGQPNQAPSRLRSSAHGLLVTTNVPENVEEAQDDEYEDEEVLHHEQMEALPTTESTHRNRDEQAWTDELPHSPKRRRLHENPHNALESPARPAFEHPTTPALALNPVAHRFNGASSVASYVNEISDIRRPAFLRSSLAPPEQHEPLPEAFSPLRRREKFIPGGMAATLQKWVIETGQSAAHSRKGQGYLRGEDYVLRVKIDSACGHGPVLAQGRQSDGTQMRLFLVMDAKKGAVDVAQGSVVSIRAPSWEVEVDQGRWTVCIDWKVL